MSPGPHLYRVLYASLHFSNLSRRLFRKLLLYCALLISKLRRVFLLHRSLTRYENADTGGGLQRASPSYDDGNPDTNSTPKHDRYDPQTTPALTNNHLALSPEMPDHDVASPVLPCETFPAICASAIPPSASVAGTGHRFPPARRGSSSYPNLRQTLAPLTTAALAPRPQSVNLPSPAGYLNSPIHLDTPSSRTPSYRNSVAELGADHLAQARAEFIEADTRSEHRIRRSRAPARPARSVASRSRSSSRHRSFSQTRPPITSSPYPPIGRGATGQHDSLSHMNRRASAASNIGGYAGKS